MSINVGNLGAFAKINNATGRGIVQLALNDESQLTKAGMYSSGRLIGRAIRSVENEMRNNATRESFLRSLAKALGVGGDVGNKGKIQLSKKLLNDIAKKLDNVEGDGSGAKLLGKSDFTIKDGYVISGCPLTERRITAIVNRVYAKAGDAGIQGNAPEPKPLDTLRNEFNDKLAAQISEMKTSGWNAAGNALHKERFADLLAKEAHIPKGMLLPNENVKEEAEFKGDEYKGIQELFQRLCSCFASDGAGGTKFDEKGFYKELELLNASVIHASGSTPTTVNAVKLLKEMNKISPRAQVEAVMEKSNIDISNKVNLISTWIKNKELKATIVNAEVFMNKLKGIFKRAFEKSFNKENLKKEIRDAIGEQMTPEFGAGIADERAITWVKEDLAVSVYREVIRIRLAVADANRKVVPAKADIPKDLNQAQIGKLRQSVEQIADNELSNLEVADYGTIDSFVENHGTLDRQVIANKFFGALCNDPVVRDYMGKPIFESSGLAEFDPLEQDANLKYGAKLPKAGHDEKWNFKEIPIEKGEGQVANRLAADLVDTYAGYARTLGAHKKPEVTILNPIFFREMYPYGESSTVVLKSQNGQERTLADEPSKGGPFDKDQAFGQTFGTSSQDPFKYRYAYNAFANLRDFFEDNIRQQFNPPAYKEILGFVSVAVMGPTGISGLLNHGQHANLGMGSPLGIMTGLGNENKRPFCKDYLDPLERKVSISIETDDGGNASLVIRHKQQLALQFSGIQDKDFQVCFPSLKFGLHKGHCDTVLKIPLNQPSPGMSKGPEETDGDIINPPKFTIETRVVPDED